MGISMGPVKIRRSAARLRHKHQQVQKQLQSFRKLCNEWQAAKDKAGAAQAAVASHSPDAKIFAATCLSESDAERAHDD